MLKQTRGPLLFEGIETEEDIMRLANEGCMKTFHVSLVFLKEALDADGIPLTWQGILVLMMMTKINDDHSEQYWNTRM
jgi:hypothetical protein